MTEDSCSIDMLLEAPYCAHKSQKVCLLFFFIIIIFLQQSTAVIWSLGRFYVCVYDLSSSAFTVLQVWRVTQTSSSCCWVESWSRFAQPTGRRYVSLNCRKTAKQYGTSRTKNSIGTKHVSVDVRPEHGRFFLIYIILTLFFFACLALLRVIFLLYLRGHKHP